MSYGSFNVAMDDLAYEQYRDRAMVRKFEKLNIIANNRKRKKKIIKNSGEQE